jgi:hypothetical protein
MPNAIDNLPPALRTSTTGQGLAGMVALAAGSVAHHYGADPDMVGAVATFAGAAVLLLFPQATGAPAGSQAVASDIDTLIAAMKLGHAASAPVKIATPAAPSPVAAQPGAAVEAVPHAA